ncbi:hypothetical protein MAR_014081 [Mya arenaria]|uniref:Uncharacterized protein n=1 Tax=Mya arenaria TaxID=6604 RepID=A0ABY7G4X1_MYAAR|nr:hypothetical protein MAR_014081 [Mya arenaria]
MFQSLGASTDRFFSANRRRSSSSSPCHRSCCSFSSKNFNSANISATSTPESPSSSKFSSFFFRVYTGDITYAASVIYEAPHCSSTQLNSVVPTLHIFAVGVDFGRTEVHRNLVCSDTGEVPRHRSLDFSNVYPKIHVVLLHGSVSNDSGVEGLQLQDIRNEWGFGTLRCQHIHLCCYERTLCSVCSATNCIL